MIARQQCGGRGFMGGFDTVRALKKNSACTIEISELILL